VTYEYIFFDGVNDSDAELAQLIKLARRVPCKINIIPYHDIAFTGVRGVSLRPSPRMNQLADKLREHQLSVFVRSSAGEDIDAACGQLAVNNERDAVRRTRTVQRLSPALA
jgi:23S rRNA (adenine2503-C2)-methyltransferase